MNKQKLQAVRTVRNEIRGNRDSCKGPVQPPPPPPPPKKKRKNKR